MLRRSFLYAFRPAAVEASKRASAASVAVVAAKKDVAAAAAAASTAASPSVSAARDDYRRKKKVSARLRPRFETFQYMLVSCAIGVATIALQHVVRTGWDEFRGNRHERAVMAEMSEKLEVRQDWCVALIYSAARHACSCRVSSVGASGGGGDAAPTAESALQFGAPLVADPLFAEQIKQVSDYLAEEVLPRHETLSMSDLWVCATITAFRSLGGPSLPVTFGRPHKTVETPFIEMPEPQFGGAEGGGSGGAAGDEEDAGIASIADPYIKNGFSTPELVALFGVRSLACHGLASKQQMARLVDTVEARAQKRGPVPLPDAPERVWGSNASTGVINFFYFQNLLEREWEQVSAAPATSATTPNAATSTSSSSTSSWLSWLGLGKPSSSTPARGGSDSAAVAAYFQAKEPVDKSSAPHRPRLCMEASDLKLLEDAFTAGWVHKFATNEVEFHRVLGEAIAKTTMLGWTDVVMNEIHWW